MEYKKANLVDRLQIKLNKEEKKKLHFWIENKKQGINISREPFLSRHEKYIYNFDDFITYNRKGLFEGSSNLHMPLTQIMVRTFHSRLYNIFTDPQTTQFIPREDVDTSHAVMLRELRNWYLWDYINKYKGIRGVAKEIFYDAVTVGYGLALKTWELKQRKTIEIEDQEFSREMEDLSPQVKEKMDLNEDIENIESDGKVDIKPYKEVQKIINVYEGTRLVSLPHEDVYFPNFIPESSDLDFPSIILVETKMDVSDIMLKVKQGVWDKKAAEKIIEQGERSVSRSQDIKDIRNRLSGYDDYSEYKKEERNIQYAFCSYDIDDDGVSEEIIVTEGAKPDTILNITFLDRVSRTGSRPIYKFDCFTKPRQAYSRGIPEFMYPLQEEMDQHHNMRIDYLKIQVCPFGVYRAGSTLKNEPIRIAPGKFIPVESVNDMKPFVFPVNATVFSGEEDRLWTYADRQASSSSLQQGITPETVGASRSTSGVITLLKQMDKEFKPTVEGCADTWKRLEVALIDDLDYRVNPIIKMKVLGAKLEEFIDLQDRSEINVVNRILSVSASLDISINVASIIHSEEVIRNEASVVLDMVRSPSLLQQFGIIGPKALFKAVEKWFRAYGLEPKDFVDEPISASRPMTLFQEIQICGQGMIPPMSVSDDHETKAKNLVAFIQTPQYQDAKAMGLYVESSDEWVLRAAQKHLNLAQMLKPQGQNTTGGGNQNFSQLGSGTAPQQGGQGAQKTTSRDLRQGRTNPGGRFEQSVQHKGMVESDQG